MDAVYHFNRQSFFAPWEYGEFQLLQIGRAICQNNTVFQTHIHSDLFELTIVTDGEGIVCTNGEAVQVKKNDIYFSFPFDAHKIVSDATHPLTFDFLAFHTKDPDFRKDLKYIVENYHSSNKRIFQDERIMTLAGNAINECSNPHIYSDQLLTAIFQELLIYLIRDLNNIVPEKVPKNVKDADSICLKMMHYIETHIFTMKTLREISDSMGFSYNYLSSLFKKRTSCQLSRFYQEKKFEAAKRLLIENNLKITEIAESLNYSSVYAFSQAFHARFGCSPNAYRKDPF